jgi:hypothetical protein
MLIEAGYHVRRPLFGDGVYFYLNKKSREIHGCNEFTSWPESDMLPNDLNANDWELSVSEKQFKKWANRQAIGL